VLSRYGWDGQPQAHRDVADIGDPQSFQCLWLMLAVSLLHNIAQVRVRGSISPNGPAPCDGGRSCARLWAIRINRGIDE
jgi:hypothetical protein